MRELIAGLIGMVLALALLWGIAGFVSLEFNPLEWTTGGRFFFVLLCVCLVPFPTIGFACAAHEMNEEAERKERKRKSRSE